MRKSDPQDGHDSKRAPGQNFGSPHTNQQGVVQSKLAKASLINTPPVAPVVYRPQTSSRTAQPKVVNAPQPTRKQPVAPPVFRPQIVARTLQPTLAQSAALKAGAGLASQLRKRPLASGKLLPSSSFAIIQRRTHDPDALAIQQRRKSWALDWLRTHGKRANIKDAWFNHVFLGLPFDGSARDLAHPTGFHAYYGQATAVPNTITIIARRGSTGTFHHVDWRFTASAPDISKTSSMFPMNLSQSKVIALILISTVNAWKNAPAAFPPTTPSGKAVTSQMLSDAFGLTGAWTLRQTGDTVYPTSP